MTLAEVKTALHKASFEYYCYPSTETAAIHQAAWEAYIALTTTRG